MESQTERPAEPLWHLWYRYLWPFQYFRDVNRGSLMERQQNYRHNRAMRSYLPGFVAKWAVLTLLLFGVGAAFDALPACVLPAACCFISGAWTLTVMLLVTASWAWLERFPERY
ncbi:MAG: hypothetical protein HGA47_10625 [Zoogloea sp.]|nr:hypothetical protein [Zoogloea sp.]